MSRKSKTSNIVENSGYLANASESRKIYNSKPTNGYRAYDAKKLVSGDHVMTRVFEIYKQMHTNQTVEYVKQAKERWLKFDHAELSVGEALEKLNSIIDQSDPDTALPNLIHAYQTAERARVAHPDKDWLHLTGLVHDLGKVMAIWGEPQWSVVGDTYPVGCRPSLSVVFRNSGTFDANPDTQNPIYNTDLGMYTEGCGFENMLMSWGHDEYFFQVLTNHKACSLPDEAFYIIKFHSFYPWHSQGEYWHFANSRDRQMNRWLQEFSKFDLYSKTNEVPDINNLKDYYNSLIQKYIPGKVHF